MENRLSHAIAIIGMAARLPEAEDYRRFWENVKSGRESIRELPDSRTLLYPLYDPEKRYARHGYIEGIDLFDPAFFKTLPAAAPCIDPAQRLLMEAVNDALEDAGYYREQLAERSIGVFFSDHQPEYYRYLTEQGLDTLAGNLPANLAGRIAYVNGFTGPAMTIDTACSSALVGLHVAAESIRNGDCELAFVGGVTLRIDLPETVPSNLGVMSPSGRCCSFSADADGTVGGEGVIAILLKPLQAALDDGDHIHAVIRGSAVNQDGSRSNGMTAPSPVAQKEVIQAAWRQAGIDPTTIGYIEAHGSATRLGDPIEITGITDAFRDFTAAAGFCPLGAVKTNIGHLGNLAGLAGLVKTVLCLSNRMIPPSVNFREPNPLIDFEHAAVYVNRGLRAWETGTGPRRAGVSSFGLSGTNAHVIVEEAPREERNLAQRCQLVSLSAPKEAILREQRERLADFLRDHPDTPLADLAFTLQNGRKGYPDARWAAGVGDLAELRAELLRFTPGEQERLSELSAVLLLPDYAEGAEGLLEEELCAAGLPTGAAAERCREVLRAMEAGLSLQPAAQARADYFTFAYALSQLWLALGVKPQTVIGLGVGEVVSAVLTQRLTLWEGMAKAVSAEEKAELNLDKLRQFLRQQVAKGRNLFLHLGPSGLLADVVKEELHGRRGVHFFPTYERLAGEGGTRTLMCTLAQLYQLGVDLRWPVVTAGKRIPLPTGFYEKRSYWFDVAAARQRQPRPEAAAHTEGAPVTPSETEPGLPELHLPGIHFMPGRSVDEIVEILTAIWRERLGLEKISPRDDFIELGGDSIRGMLLMHDIQKYFRVTLDIAYLLQYGTIEALSEKIKEEMAAQEADTGSTALLPREDAGELFAVPEENTPLLPTAEPVYRRGRVAYYELSPSQKNLWLVHQLDPQEIVYNEPMPLILKGPLQADVLAQALQTMVDRHSALRTYFTLIEGVPLQGVHDQLTVRVECEDRRGAENGQTELERLVHIEAEKPFDLTAAPLFRAKLIRLQEEMNLFIFVVHHIVFDGWSILVFMREICQLYDAYARHLPNPLPPVRVEYHDFAQWQSRLLAQGEMAAAERYWLNKLSGDLPILDLPTDFSRPAEKGYEGSSYHFRLAEDLSARIKAYGKRAGATLFATMLAFFEALLYKYTWQEEFVIGTPSANRPHESLWGLIGFFVNTFAVRQYVSGNEEFAALLQRVKADLLASYPHKDYPFTALVSRLNLKRDPSRSVLFDVMYVFHNVGSIESEGDRIAGRYGGISFAEVKRRELVSDYDLKWEWEEADTHFNGKIEYSTRLFTEETIRRMADHMTVMMADLLDHPEKRLADLTMMTKGEQEEILHTLNATAAPFPAEQTVPELFARQAARTPDRVAAICGGQSLTYRTLEELSDRAAGILRAKGVRANSIVPVMVRRSLDMLIGIYGIMKAGGAYLPIDTNYPAERIRYILEDSGAGLLLTHQPAAREAEGSGVEAVYLDALRVERPREAEEDRGSGGDGLLECCQPPDLAYVIYTSGSTGKPKGVMIEHRALVNRLHWMQKTYPLAADDTILQKTPYTFDVSVWELFWWALYGAKVCLLAHGGEKEPAAIIEAVRNAGVTVLHFVPSMLNAFLDYLEALPDSLAGMASVRRVFASGEALKKKTVVQFAATLGMTNGTELHNLYGPTEAAIDVSYFDCRNGIPGETVPIGRPIDNIRLYIVDESLRLVPAGVAGEICIAGVGLARGYLNRPELTDEKFVPHPAVEGERMYRTGDLGRWMRDGNIEYLGRIDHQVKVRGYRIELGEIEAALIGHPAVREAVVLAREEANGLKELTAYIILRQMVSTAGLKRHLLEQLPEYMVPVHFIRLDELPLLANGKTDRKALLRLPVRDEGGAGAGRTAVPPRNELEAKIAAIWAEILRVPEVGIADNFFELGGDSIKAIQVAVEVSKLGIPIQMNDIIRHQTIDQVCAHLAAASTAEEPAAVKRSSTGYELVEGEASLTPIQHWFFEQQFPVPGHWNQSLFLEVERSMDRNAMARAFHRLIEHHDALRLVYHEKTGTFFHHNRMLRRGFQLVTHDLSALTPTEQDQQMAARGRALKASTDLEGELLIKACLFDLGVRGLRLLITIHHLLIDGVSWRILLDDLNQLYQGLVTGTEPTLPPKTMAFKDWADMLCEYSQRDEVQREIPYWEEILRSARPLPVEMEEGEALIASVFTLTGELTEEETNALLTEAHGAYNTNINDILLTALVTTIADWTGDKSVSLDLESHGRHALLPDWNISRTVGWFTALYPVGADFRTAAEIGERIKAVKESLRAVPQGGIGYGILRYLNRHWGDRVRPSQLIFNYLGQMDQEFAGQSFRVAGEESGSDFAETNQLSCLMEVVSYTVKGRYQVSWSYSRNRYHDTTIQALLEGFLRNLRMIIHYCTGGEHVGYTPSDFPLARLSQKALDQLSAEIAELLEGIE